MQEKLFEEEPNAILGGNDYRYFLKRCVDEHNDKKLLFIMLNPSTADDSVDDPTIRKCKEFTKRNGYGIMGVVNLYAIRSPYPAALWESKDPIGTLNDHYTSQAVMEADAIICAWGSRLGPDLVRHTLVRKLVDEHAKCKVYALKINKCGRPSHPLYLPYDSKFVDFSPKEVPI